VRYLDSKKREEEMLNLVVESYIKESKPISSCYLCEKFNLSFSTATIRNILESLEKKGLLSHIHISSGRVPTKKGFRYYVAHLKEEEILKEELNIKIEIGMGENIEELFYRTLDVLAQISKCISLVAISGWKKKMFLRGMRFILEQPEFENINRLRSLFYTLEVKIDDLQELLFNYLDKKWDWEEKVSFASWKNKRLQRQKEDKEDKETSSLVISLPLSKREFCRVSILIGDDIGFEEISDCSLVISGFQRDDLRGSLALLGPMRMDYIKAISSLFFVRQRLEESLRRCSRI